MSFRRITRKIRRIRKNKMAKNKKSRRGGMTQETDTQLDVNEDITTGKRTREELSEPNFIEKTIQSVVGNTNNIINGIQNTINNLGESASSSASLKNVNMPKILAQLCFLPVVIFLTMTYSRTIGAVSSFIQNIGIAGLDIGYQIMKVYWKYGMQASQNISQIIVDFSLDNIDNLRRAIIGIESLLQYVNTLKPVTAAVASAVASTGLTYCFVKNPEKITETLNNISDEFVGIVKDLGPSDYAINLTHHEEQPLEQEQQQEQQEAELPVDFDELNAGKEKLKELLQQLDAAIQSRVTNTITQIDILDEARDGVKTSIEEWEKISEQIVSSPAYQQVIADVVRVRGPGAAATQPLLASQEDIVYDKDVKRFKTIGGVKKGNKAKKTKSKKINKRGRYNKGRKTHKRH